MAGSVVVIERAKPLDYLKDFVVLPSSFGTPAYDAREDVIGIRAAVDNALDKLDEKVHFSEQLKNGRPVIIKPNLVSVYHGFSCLSMTREGKQGKYKNMFPERGAGGCTGCGLC